MPAQMASLDPPKPIPTLGGLSLQPSNNRTSYSTSPAFRSGHLNLDTFSPVNQNGSFEFDRVLKRGDVQKRVEKNRVQSSPNTTASIVERSTDIPTGMEDYLETRSSGPSSEPLLGL